MSSATWGYGDDTVGGARRYEISRPQVADECIGDELVIINFVSGKYYGVRGSGVRIWRLLEAGCAIDEIIASFRRAPEGSDVTRQTIAFIRALEDESLIVASAATRLSVSLEEVGAIDTFEPPQIESRDDLQDYLLLDPIHDVDDQGWPKPSAAGQ